MRGMRWRQNLLSHTEQAKRKLGIFSLFSSACIYTGITVAFCAMVSRVRESPVATPPHLSLLKDNITQEHPNDSYCKVVVCA